MPRSERFYRWCCRWLPIIMGCHCRPDRSFYYRGKKFPVCARCTGMLGGFLLAILTRPFLQISPWIMVLLMIPGILDGTIQLKTKYESNNIRRLWTGLLMGYGAMGLVIWSLALTCRAGFTWGQNLKK